MANPYIGQVSPVAFSYAPAYWAFCSGGTVPMNQYGALFALIGTTFGGDGVTKIGLPNLNGAAPCGAGQGTGLSYRALGQSFGTASVTIDQTTLASHTHTMNAVSQGRIGVPTATPLPSTGLGSLAAAVTPYSNSPANATMSPQAISVYEGGGSGHNNLQPFLAINYCIALMGQYPDFD